jgi:hypothetical protein
LGFSPHHESSSYAQPIYPSAGDCTLLTISALAKEADGYPNSIKPVGIIKGLSDTALLEVVQRQTFRYSGICSSCERTIREKEATPSEANIFGIMPMKLW